MPDKPLHLVSGNPTEVEAIDESTGAGDAGKLIAADAAGKLDESFLPTGVGADVSAIACTEDLAAGDYVNIFSSTGYKCRKADASGIATKAHGFVKSAFTNGQTATIYHEGSNDVLTGLSPGDYYLSETAGGVTQTPPTTSGSIVQKVGVSTAATVINTELGETYVRA